MKLVIPVGEIVNASAPRMNDAGQPILWSKVLFMGGTLNSPNPQKLPNGNYTDIEVEVRLNAQGKSFQDRETKVTNTSIGLSVACVRVISAKPMKG